MAGSHPLDSFGTILSGLAKRLGLEARLVELRLQHHWPDIVGEPTRAHTWPDQIRYKKLYLLVRNSVWLQQLTFLKPTLLAKLRTEIGQDLVTDIVFRVGEIPARVADSDGAAAPETTAISEGRLTEVLSHTATIRDPALRQRLTEVISKYPAQVPPPPEEGPSQTP